MFDLLLVGLGFIAGVLVTATWAVVLAMRAARYLRPPIMDAAEFLKGDGE